MAVVDAHCHASRYWLEPIETLVEQMQRAQVDHAVLTCAAYATDSKYEEECVQRFPDKFCYVGAVQPKSPQVGDAVRDFASHGAAGVRMRTPAVGASTAGALAVLRAAAECGMTVTCLVGRSAEFISSDFISLLEEVPNATVVIEHLGSLKPAGEENEADRREIFGLARYAGVHMKFHGLGEFCRRKEPPFVPFPFVEPIPPYLEWAYDAFGPKRLLWGSDFPNVCAREGYENSLRLPRAHFAHLPDSELEDMFGGNALRLFPLT